MFSLIPKLQNRHLCTENYQRPSFQSSTMTWGKWLKPFLPALTFTFQIHAEGYWRNNLDTCNEVPSMLYEYKTLLGNSAKNYCLTVRVADFSSMHVYCNSDTTGLHNYERNRSSFFSLQAKEF